MNCIVNCLNSTFRQTLKSLLLVLVLTSLSLAWSQDEPQTNVRSEYWQAVKQGEAGKTQIKGQDQGVLINTSGETWRQDKEAQREVGKWVIPGALVAVFLFHLALGGGVKLENRSGKLIKRFSGFERFIHWTTAIAFFILMISGLLLLLGREVLIPLMGGDAFAPIAKLSKLSHNYVGPVFLALIVIMFIIWIRDNIPNRVDVNWLVKAGGLFSKNHQPAERMNGGEKVWFWLIFFVGTLGLGITGVLMDFPNLGSDRSDMQLANTIHTIASFIFIVAAIGHIYIGTKGVEGSLEGMKTGYVDENWAKEHHSLWYEKVKNQQPKAK